MIRKANKIDEKSWINEDRFESFKYAWQYAATQTRAIPAMSKLTPEEAYFLFYSLKRGEERFGEAD